MKFYDLVEVPRGSDLHPYDAIGKNNWNVPDGAPSHVIDFYRDGYVTFENIIPKQYIDNYLALRKRLDIPLSGWDSCTPYMHHDEIKDLCCFKELTSKISDLFAGDEVGLNLNLTGFKSTERQWHQDYYLNVPGVGSYYAACWLALGEIDHNVGPFEFAVGSHQLYPMTMKKIFEHIPDSEKRDPNWPKTTERFVKQACEDVIKEEGYPIRQFLARRGDVLIWHSRLLHRGTVPKIAGAHRLAIIAHYSVVSRRSKLDMPRYARHKDQGLYFIL